MKEWEFDMDYRATPRWEVKYHIPGEFFNRIETTFGNSIEVVWGIYQRKGFEVFSIKLIDTWMKDVIEGEYEKEW